VKTAKESWNSRLAHIPAGTAALFFIQIFATLGFAVLYSTLVLYATRHLHFSAKEDVGLSHLDPPERGPKSAAVLRPAATP